jgi:hypothetical protein
MGPRALLVVGAVGLVAFFLWKKSAGASEKQPGFGEPGFVAAATALLPVTVTGCSFARVGTVLIDAKTGKEISQAEGARRALTEDACRPIASTSTRGVVGTDNIFTGKR